MTHNSYIKGLLSGIGSLLTGLKVTGREFFTPHDAEGKNRRIACGLCQAACPNGTIHITTETVTDPETGKPKRRLARYEYDLGSCMFCQLCVNACPHDAIRFSTAFEHAVYTRSKLVKTLNKI